MAGVLGFGIDADAAAGACRRRLGQCDDLVKGRDRLLAVEGRIGGAQLRQTLTGAQRLQFGQREILGEPAGDGLAIDAAAGLAVGEFRAAGDIGGGGDFILVAGHKLVVLGGNQIGLDEVGALLDRQGIAGQRVLRPVGTGAAVGDDDRRQRRCQRPGRRQRRCSGKAGDHGNHSGRHKSGRQRAVHQRHPKGRDDPPCP